MTNADDQTQLIVALLRKTGGVLRLNEIGKHLGYSSNSPEFENLRFHLSTLVDSGVLKRLSRRRYALSGASAEGFVGILTLTKGMAIVTTNDTDFPVMKIKRGDMHTALHGDTVRVQPLALNQGRTPRGQVTCIVERSGMPISGTVEQDASFSFLIPDDDHFHVDFLVSTANLNGALHGDKVVAEFVHWEHPNASPEVRVTEVLGASGKASIEFTAIRREFGLESHFPPLVAAEAEAAPEPSIGEDSGREDARHLATITIDPDDARDYDDALSLEQKEDGSWELGVHIADVSWYVAEGSALDVEALKRGNSTYLVDGVVPMLPERLSNDLCSLVPEKERYAYSVFMRYPPNNSARLIGYRIVPTVIKSDRRFTYTEVDEILKDQGGEHGDMLLQIRSLADRLQQFRMKNGGIAFETQEIRFKLDGESNPVSASIKAPSPATNLVEECMLAANRTVAEHIKKLFPPKKRSGVLPPFIYRIHEDPDPEKLSTAVEILRAIGITVPDGKLDSKDINKILGQVRNRPEQAAVNSMLLRSMSKAVYSEHNVAHYGLGFKDYTHFTSPIRRYCDLWVHRVLREYNSGLPAANRLRLLAVQAAENSTHVSITERLSITAERASVKLAGSLLARVHIGEDFEGTVTGVTNFGLFVMLDDLCLEGVIHVRRMLDDYYYLNEKKMQLMGKRSKKFYRIGTRVRAKIIKADVEKREVDLELIQQIDPGMG